ncbi:glucosyl-3-phosphoglycerate synthase [Halovenus aranensis]|jgi:glucosyl-3-phosphoglycerate synthase|uniref:Glucosyl-3-phosphoglycerate synthase n=1 Tax=Halovenus aranensis TaxID=890420 RepID=A0A1G8WHP8_9EURY|nr:glycosyl transferase family 2 [Halovenus aranensis]SDJ77637.1 glucosyl-3-phosphoglycerate synthase [Halovenus aranensis]
MDYAQEYVTTVHDLTDPTPAAPLAECAVVVPIAGDEPAAVTPEHIFSTLETVGPASVVVPLRAPAETAGAFREWIQNFEVPVTVLWCDADGIGDRLAKHGLDGPHGKGRDVWLGLGVAADRADYVVVHDADATTYGRHHVPRLLAPLTHGHDFVKGYYARVENEQLYGRLTRLFVAPLVDALRENRRAAFLEYLDAFRYPLAGEFAVTAEAARRLRAQRTWGLEVGLLGDAYGVAGRDRTAQVDLGVHRHDHRPVEGSSGLSTMADEVGAALFRALADHGIDPDYDRLRERYRTAADRLVDQYATAASLNDLEYDPAAEREQVRAYAESVDAPGPDDRLPAWTETDLSPSAVLHASRNTETTASSPSPD